MSLKGLKGTFKDFIGAGGHISAGISKALGATAEAINGYVQRHVIGMTVSDVERLDTIINDGIAAASINNSLDRTEPIDLDNVPIVADQYGDEPEGRRITTAIIYGDDEEDPGKVIRLDFEDNYTRADLEDLVESIILGWLGESPEAFTKENMENLRRQAIREIYTSRRF